MRTMHRPMTMHRGAIRCFAYVPTSHREYRQDAASLLKSSELEFAIAGVLPAVPLFPLAHFVKFPTESFALHIFELRYKAMFRPRAAEGPALFGMVCGDSEGLGSSGERVWPGSDVATLCRVTSSEKLENGNLLVNCEGLRRISLKEPSIVPLGYWAAEAELFADSAEGADDDDGSEAALELELHTRLMMVAQKLRQHSTEADQAFESFVQIVETNRERGAEKFGCFVASLLEVDWQQKMSLLRMRDSKKRLRALTRMLGRQTGTDAS